LTDTAKLITGANDSFSVQQRTPDMSGVAATLSQWAFSAELAGETRYEPSFN